ncbi:pancreatic triacylglycerol lipase-like [Onthophagus taurus]|uniref:pancreatic triacylglycerol lipase-like n=1 Tax=Onthophagus taurus TaxID=166361 RepID=UPI0039BE49D9
MKIAVLFVIFVFAPPIFAEVQPEDIKYFLWNSKTSNEEVSINNYGTNLIRNVPWKILVHGWMDNIEAFWYLDAINVFVDELNANVVIIDWSEHSRQIYSTSMARVPIIGDYIAQFILGLVNLEGVDLNQVHLLGHSLGGQLTGFTGKAVQSRTGKKVDRITGLDPAGPGFATASRENRLDSNDANKVDVIHTDSGVLGLGISISVGHVNFWPNGGSAIQPGCSEFLCSHSRSAWFYIEGVKSKGFVSTRCSSFLNYRLGLCRNNEQNLLGEFTDHTLTGDFYLITNAEAPFARG